MISNFSFQDVTDIFCYMAYLWIVQRDQAFKQNVTEEFGATSRFYVRKSLYKSRNEIDLMISRLNELFLRIQIACILFLFKTNKVSGSLQVLGWPICHYLKVSMLSTNITFFKDIM